VKRKSKSKARNDSSDDDDDASVAAAKKGTKRKRGEEKTKRRATGKTAYLFFLEDKRPDFVAEHPELKSNMSAWRPNKRHGIECGG
jgi:hypothetical protein